jgi:hypothetical protein
MTDTGKPKAADDADLIRRSLAAYYRSAPAPARAPGQDSRVTEHEGKRYVILANTSGVIAVYRVRNDGILKGLRRWPKAIEATT